MDRFLRDRGAEVWRLDGSVVARKGSGRRLILNSHLDTAPANDSWTRPPWTPSVEEGRVYGLGSNDAKASVAAMTATFLSTEGCEVCLILALDEETTSKGTEAALDWLVDEQGWVAQGAVVGEPTGLDIGVAQKGLLILELIARGDACHAANASKIGAVNPIYILAEDLVALRGLELGSHAALGKATLQPTVLTGSQAHNQVPGQASAVLDVRTVPGSSHDEVIESLQRVVQGEINVRSKRLEPYALSETAEIVCAALAARPSAKTFGSPTMSDQVHFKTIPAIKCGPGVSSRSHTADEFVLESEILEGVGFYRSLIQTFAKGGTV